MKNTEIICINDTYPEDTLAFYRENGISYPEEGKIYTCRELINHTVGRKGLLLHEIHNPKVKIDAGIVKGFLMEPTFNVSRFSTLDGQQLTMERIKEMENA